MGAGTQCLECRISLQRGACATVQKNTGPLVLALVLIVSEDDDVVGRAGLEWGGELCDTGEVDADDMILACVDMEDD